MKLQSTLDLISCDLRYVIDQQHKLHFVVNNTIDLDSNVMFDVSEFINMFNTDSIELFEPLNKCFEYFNSVNQQLNPTPALIDILGFVSFKNTFKKDLPDLIEERSYGLDSLYTLFDIHSLIDRFIMDTYPIVVWYETQFFNFVITSKMFIPIFGQILYETKEWEFTKRYDLIYQVLNLIIKNQFNNEHGHICGFVEYYQNHKENYPALNENDIQSYIGYLILYMSQLDPKQSITHMKDCYNVVLNQIQRKLTHD